MTIGVRDDEIVSYDIARSLPIGMTTAVVLSSLLGVASFLLYNYKVVTQYFQNVLAIDAFRLFQLHPWSILINHQDDSTTPPEDIYIPVPYDPEIPGVRYIDDEETLSDDGGEDIELQDLGQGGDLADMGALDHSLSIEEEPPAEDNLQTGDIENVV